GGTRAVGRDDVQPAVARVAGGRQQRLDVGAVPDVVGLAVLLLATDDDLDPTVAGEVGQRGRGRQLTGVVDPGPRGERHPVAHRVGGLDGRRIDDEHREAVDGRAVVVPGVHVPVEGGGDDLEVAVAVEVAEGGRRGEAPLGAVVPVLV